MRTFWMKRALVLLGLAVVLTIIAACTPAPTATAVPPAAATPVPPTAAPAATSTVAQTQPASKEAYKIGVALSLTGPLAVVGVEVRDGLVLEVERINAAGGVDGHPIQLVIEDDGGDPTRFATAMTKLIRQDNVLALFGPWGVPESTAKPVAEREQVPLIVPVPATAETRGKFKWSFNMAPSDIIGADSVIEVIKYKGYTKVVVVAEAGASSQFILPLLQEKAPPAGIQVVALSDTLGFRDVDVTPQLTKLKDLITKEKPQAVVLLASLSAVPFLRGQKQQGIDLPVVGGWALSSYFFLQAAGNDANGLVVPGQKMIVADQLPDSDPQKAINKELEQRFVAKFGKKPLGGAQFARDAIGILANALKVAGADRAKIRDAIEKTTNFVGATAIYNYSPNDHEGITKEAMAILDIKDNKFVLVKTIK